MYSYLSIHLASLIFDEYFYDLSYNFFMTCLSFYLWWPVYLSFLYDISLYLYFMTFLFIYLLWPIYLSFMTYLSIFYDLSIYLLWPIYLSFVTNLFIFYDLSIYLFIYLLNYLASFICDNLTLVPKVTLVPHQDDWNTHTLIIL